MQVLPNSLRGAVLGYASLAMSNEGALCITFGSPSPSFADALGRIFFKVCLVVATDALGPVIMTV